MITARHLHVITWDEWRRARNGVSHEEAWKRRHLVNVAARTISRMRVKPFVNGGAPARG